METLIITWTEIEKLIRDDLQSKGYAITKGPDIHLTGYPEVDRLTMSVDGVKVQVKKL